MDANLTLQASFVRLS